MPTSAEIESALLEKEKSAIMSEESLQDTASMMFSLYYPKFAQLVDQLSTKSLRRLIKAMVAVPLEEANLNLKIEKERVGYAIMEKLMISKFGLVINTLWQEEQRMKQEPKEENKENDSGKI